MQSVGNGSFDVSNDPSQDDHTRTFRLVTGPGENNSNILERGCARGWCGVSPRTRQTGEEPQRRREDQGHQALRSPAAVAGIQTVPYLMIAVTKAQSHGKSIRPSRAARVSSPRQPRVQSTYQTSDAGKKMPTRKPKS